jgi:hypothetical protein
MNNAEIKYSCSTLINHKEEIKESCILDLFGIGFALGIIFLTFLTIFADSKQTAKKINKNILYALVVGVVLYFTSILQIKLIITAGLLILAVKICIQKLNRLGVLFGYKNLELLDASYIAKKLAYLIFAITGLFVLTSASENLVMIYSLYKQVVYVCFGFWLSISLLLKWIKN